MEFWEIDEKKTSITLPKKKKSHLQGTGKGKRNIHGLLGNR